MARREQVSGYRYFQCRTKVQWPCVAAEKEILVAYCTRESKEKEGEKTYETVKIKVIFACNQVEDGECKGNQENKCEKVMHAKDAAGLAQYSSQAFI